MKIFVLIFLYILHNVNTFEYHDVDNTESFEDPSFEDYYKSIQEDQINNNYDAPLVEKATTNNVETNYFNEAPIESNEKSVESYYERVSDATVMEEGAVSQNNQKPFYDLAEAPELFRKFIKDYEKQYRDADDYNKHYENFVNNLKEINELNKEQDATFDINMFADLGEGESITG